MLARKARSGVMVVTRNCKLCRKGKFFQQFAWLGALYLTGRNCSTGGRTCGETEGHSVRLPRPVTLP